MAIKIGNIQPSQKGELGISGWCFTLQDSTAQPARFVTIVYRTQAEAEAAREKIRAATVNAIDVAIAG